MQELMVTDLPTASGILEAKLEKFSGFEQWKFTVGRDHYLVYCYQHYSQLFDPQVV
jgi:hypothetical protein